MLKNISTINYTNSISKSTFGNSSPMQYPTGALQQSNDTVIINGQERYPRKKKKENNLLKTILIMGGIAIGGIVFYKAFKNNFSKTTNTSSPKPEFNSKESESHIINGVAYAGKVKKEDLHPSAQKATQKITEELPKKYQDRRNAFKEQFKNLYNKSDISEEELDQMIMHYSHIAKKEGAEFVTDAFYQIKKDYGYEDIDMFLDIKKAEKLKGNQVLYGEYMTIRSIPQKDTTMKKHSSGITIRVGNTIPKKEIADTISHEFTHMYQDQIMFKTDPKKFRDAYIAKLEAQIKAQKRTDVTIDDIKAQADRVCLLFKNYFGDKPTIKKGSKEYDYAQKCFEWADKYVNDDDKLYRASFLENDAIKKGSIMKKIFSLIWD